MSFLDGVTSKVNTAEIALRRELEARRSRWDRQGYRYRGAGDILLQHGRFFPGAVCPAEFEERRGEPNQCFVNALYACEADDRLSYYEGVYSCGLGHFTHHAWCVFEGKVVEVTMPTTGLDGYHTPQGFAVMPVEKWSYWGVKWTRELVRSFGDTDGYELPLLDRPKADVTYSRFDNPDNTRNHHDFPILRYPYDSTRTELP